jgi:serine/threonine protein phosphatase 1
MSRTIAIGDIHGCDLALEAVLTAIAPAAEDTIVTLGDVIDRGPNSKRVIELLLELSTRCRYVGLLGNHEEMMLKVVVERQSPEFWLRYGGVATLDSYRFCGKLDVVPPEHIALLQGFGRYYETPTHFFTHANYEENKPLEQQADKYLRWKRLDEHLPGPHLSGKTAVLGHTADESGEIFSLKHLICIDTFCHGGQWLTALDVSSGKIWQANEEGKLRA